MEQRIEASGKLYVSLREHLYGWLKAMKARGHDEAKELIDVLKDLPDLIIFDAEPGKSWSRCLLLELKRKTGQGRPGQRRLAGACFSFLRCFQPPTGQKTRRLAKWRTGESEEIQKRSESAVSIVCNSTRP